MSDAPPIPRSAVRYGDNVARSPTARPASVLLTFHEHIHAIAYASRYVATADSAVGHVGRTSIPSSLQQKLAIARDTERHCLDLRRPGGYCMPSYDWKLTCVDQYLAGKLSRGFAATEDYSSFMVCTLLYV